MSNLTHLTAPTIDDFTKLAREEYEKLPADIREKCGEIVFRIQDYADDDVLDAMDADAFEITGLFVGQELGAQDASSMPREPSMVFLYRVPILAEWAETGIELGHLIGHVIVHEIGHHFGLSDEDMHRIEGDHEH